VPSGGVEASAQEALANAQQAERIATGNPAIPTASVPSSDAVPSSNEPVAPEATDISKAGVNQVKAETETVNNDPEPQNTGDRSGVGDTQVASDEAQAPKVGGRGTGMGAVKSIAESEKFKTDISKLAARYKAGERLKQKYDQKVSDLFSDKKMVKIKNISQNFVDKLKVVMVDMKEKATKGKNAKMGMLLTGDPGVGKTSFIRSLADAVGLPLITIEAPHITKEHLINIPFLVKDPFVPEGVETNWTVDNAESNIVTEMIKARGKKKSRFTDAFWMKKIRTSPIIDKAFDQDPNLLQTAQVIRQFFSCIFFVDEFFRTDDPSVQNILRAIINGRVGSDALPDDVYCIYAANMRNDDGSFSKIPSNMQFGGMLNFDMATAEDWGKQYFNVQYTENVAMARELKAKVESNTATDEEREMWNASEKTRNLANMTVSINQDLTTAITDAVGENLGKVTDGKGLRLSPRRLEQIVLSVNAIADGIGSGKYPFLTPENINAFLRVQFRDYLSGAVNEDVFKAVSKAVLEKLGIPQTDKVTHPSNWEDSMKLQLFLKDKLGSFRSYPTVVAGEPGIGKTQIMKSALGSMNIQMITIEAHTLTKASVIGMPIVKTMSEDEVRLRKETTDKYLSKNSQISKEMMDQVIVESGMDSKVVADYMSKLDVGRYTEFAPPALYRYIMFEYFRYLSDYARYDREEQQGVAKNDRKGRPRPEGKYKVALFLDELSRVEDTSIFNALRLVLLEGKFGDGNKLPDDMLIIGALNPTDRGENVRELTDHMKDVLDIVPAEANWPEWYKWLQSHAQDLYSEQVKLYNEIAEKGTVELEEGDSVPAIIVASDMYPLGISPFNFAEAVAEVLNYVASTHMNVGKFGDQPETLKRFPMIGTPAVNFYWQGMSPTDKALYHNPRNLALTFDAMVSRAFSDAKVSIGGEELDGNFLLFKLFEVEPEDRPPAMIESFFGVVRQGFLNAYEAQMHGQLTNMQEVSENSYKACLANFTQGLMDDGTTTILEQVLVGKESKLEVENFDAFIKKNGLSVNSIKNYVYAEKISNDGEAIVAEFNAVYEEAIKNPPSGGYTMLMRLMWMVATQIEEKLQTFEGTENKKVTLDVVSGIRTGLKKSLINWYGVIFEPLFTDEASVKTVMEDEKFEATFTVPNIEYLKDYV
jgi:MoxR-like ATPase